MPAPFDGESYPPEIESTLTAALHLVDPAVTAFEPRMRGRDGTYRWILSIAVPSGHSSDVPRMTSIAAGLGLLIEGVFEYEGELERAIMDGLGEAPFDEDDLPTTSEDQSCAICGLTPRWVHPLDERRSTFKHDGRRYTLPTFWTTCARCEALLEARDDAELARIHHADQQESLAMSVAMVDAFRTASTGRKEMGPSRYPE